MKLAGLIGGLLAFFLLAFLDTPLRHDPEFGTRPVFAAAGAALMAIWWLTEALPIYVTACVPLVLFPLTGVFGGGLGGGVRQSVLPYLDPYIFLFAGGMGIAAAMQQWNLHRRIALGIMDRIGSDPKRLLAGTLVSTAFISMWISNTATAAMMMPIGLAVVLQVEDQRGAGRLRHYGMAIMLAIAYGANVGGIGTKIGTAPNAQFSGFMERLGIDVTFLQFLVVGLPFVLMFLPVVWWMLWRIGRQEGLAGEVGEEVIADELAKLGPVRRPERIVLGVFLATAGLWIAGKLLTDFLKTRVPFDLTSAHVEGGIAMLAALVLMLWRTEGRQVLGFRALGQVPWETLLLLGGGFAMAASIQKSGLSAWLGAQLLAIRGVPPFGQVLLSSMAVVALSAVASNTATIAVMLVVLKDAVAPEVMTTTLFAATIACSCDFALPVGTPPNAIVFGSGYVSIPRMARTGVVLDLLASILAAAWCWLVVRLVL
ncbi:MAG: solute carrier family 13 (sodium-dependent dicarboxylate transporter), er 2/3/5 [Acidobacteriota bacterium]|nr:solute carrier family 13 (sodium-dependent dicarboxylate transporter), er 2/3/5 [Acidobacteriota bacterium]